MSWAGFALQAIVCWLLLFASTSCHPSTSTFIKNLPPPFFTTSLSNKAHYLAPGKHSINAAAVNTIIRTLSINLWMATLHFWLFLHLLNSHTLDFVITAGRSTDQIYTDLIHTDQNLLLSFLLHLCLLFTLKEPPIRSCLYCLLVHELPPIFTSYQA